MRPAPDYIPSHSDERASMFSAFGLLLEVDPSIDVSGLGLSEAPGGVRFAGGLAGPEPPTRIKLDPEELEWRWSSCGATARRMRELRDGESAILTVDLNESAGYLLRAEGVGQVLIALDGRELFCDPLPERPDWTFILPAQALPLAATLRGYELLHASGIVIGGGAALFAGPPGAGKSSLAAAFLRRGAQLIGDDSIALEGRNESIVVHPGVGLIYLRSSEHGRLCAGERDALGPSRPFAGKQRYVCQATAETPPFASLFLLERSAGGPAIEHIEDVDPFSLLAATFNLSVRTSERLTRQLEMVEMLVATEQIYRLRVQPGTEAARLADAVQQHFASAAR